MTHPEPPMPTSTPTASSPWGRVVAVVVGLAAALVVMLTAFALPSIHSAPRDVPVAVVGPAQAITQFETALESASPGGFDVTTAADADESRQMILDRDVYGAFVLTQEGVTVQTASAASSAVATTLATIGQQMGATTSMPVDVQDLVPFSADDPRGVGLSAGALPLAIGGFAAAMGSLQLLRGTRQRLAAAVLFSVVGGFALTAVLQYGFGTFTGNYVLTSLAAVLGIAATSLFILGLERLLKGPGIAIGAILVILLGNPLSGLVSAPEYLPQPWGTIGQLLPPGATGTLLRNVSFFDGAAITTPVIVLSCYVVLGIALYLIGSQVSRTRTTPTPSETTPVPAEA